MRPPYVRSEDGKPFTDSRPRAWLTPSQRDHSANFIGSEADRAISDAIRAQEQIGSDGMVRALPALSISYDDSIRMLGMDK